MQDMNKKLSILICAAIGILSSCQSYDFDQEQYRKEINLLQDNSSIYDRQVIDMNDEFSEKGAVLKIVSGLSGSLVSSEDYKVTIMRDDSLFKAYNKSTYDVDSARYAKLLPEKFYEEPELESVIKAGESKVIFPIKLKDLEKLSPDSIYFLNYKLDAENSHSFNKKKSQVLVRLHWKNEFGNTRDKVSYTYNPATVTTVPQTVGGDVTVRRPTTSLIAYPIGRNKVRFSAGDEEYGDIKTALPKINKMSVVFEVGEQLPENPLARLLTIKAYKSDGIEVVQMTPIGEFDNTFLLNEAKYSSTGNSVFYKEFRVHYKYRLLEKQNDGTVTPGQWKIVKAKLRHEYNPRKELL